MKRHENDWKQEVGERLSDAGERAADTGRTFWLAGLGLAATVSESASDLFETLVAKGRQRGTADLKAAQRAFASARKTVEKRAGELAEGAEETMGAVFHRLGLPTRNEVDALAARVEKLATEVGRRRTARRAA
ncbi:MAG: phasin family protein [Thermoanaerobaculia bacterium]